MNEADSKSSLRRRIFVFTGWLGVGLALYIIPYGVNSMMGGYSRRPLVDPNRYYRIGILVWPDAIMWQPYFGRWSGRERTLVGQFYYPLIMLDRKFVHKTHYLEDADYTVWKQTDYPRQMHPSPE